MASRAEIDDFLAQSTLAVVGASRSGRKFGNAVVRELEANGYTVVPVHPDAAEIGGRACARTARDLPPEVGGVVTVVPPQQTEIVVRDAIEAGVTRVWMQLGSGSPAAAELCSASGVTAIREECILMYLERGPAIHRVHRWLRTLFGRMPKA